MCSVFANKVWCRCFGALLLLAVLAGCGGEQSSPEHQIRELIAAMEQAVEAGSIRDAAEFIDPDYRDARHAGKREAVATLFAYLRRHRQIHLFTLIRELTLTTDHAGASVIVYVAMSGTPIESMESVISVKADLYRFDVHLAIRDEAWRIISSQWRRADLSALR